MYARGYNNKHREPSAVWEPPEVGETFDPSLTKADASKMIDELRKRDRRLTNPGGR
jgi:hypothetical protein